MAKGYRKIKREKYKETEDKGYLPTVYFDAKQLPAIKDWEVGKKYYISLEVKQVSHEKEEGKPESASFEIIGVKADSKLTKGQKETMDLMT